jgi:hypothetical protein
MTGPYRRVRSDGAIPTVTKTISSTGCQFDPAQLAHSEAAGAFGRRPLSQPHDTGADRHGVLRAAMTVLSRMDLKVVGLGRLLRRPRGNEYRGAADLRC